MPRVTVICCIFYLIERLSEKLQWMVRVVAERRSERRGRKEGMQLQGLSMTWIFSLALSLTFHFAIYYAWTQCITQYYCCFAFPLRHFYILTQLPHSLHLLFPFPPLPTFVSSSPLPMIFPVFTIPSLMPQQIFRNIFF